MYLIKTTHWKVLHVRNQPIYCSAIHHTFKNDITCKIARNISCNEQCFILHIVLLSYIKEFLITFNVNADLTNNGIFYNLCNEKLIWCTDTDNNVFCQIMLTEI